MPELLDRDILYSLETIARQRLEVIAEAKAMREEEEDRHAGILQAIAQTHRDANAALVADIESAHKAGLPKAVIYSHIGMTGQRISQIKKALADYQSNNQKEN